MNDAIRKLIDSVLPPLIEEAATRKTVYWLYWLTTACLAWLFVVTNPVFGSLVVVPPVLLVWLASLVGLDRVPGLAFGAVVTLALVPAFFLGQAQAPDGLPTGFVLAGLLIFLGWVAAFPTMLHHVDRHHRVKRHKPIPDPFADFRVMLVRLSMTAVVMSVIGENLTALVCVWALLYRRTWSAAVAGLACLVFPLLSIGGGGIGWDADLLDVLAAGLTAFGWYGAIRNPNWRGGLFFRVARAALSR